VQLDECPGVLIDRFHQPILQAFQNRQELPAEIRILKLCILSILGCPRTWLGALTRKPYYNLVNASLWENSFRRNQ